MVTTLPQLLVHSVTSYPKPDFMLFKKAGAYTPISSAEFGASVKHLALGLRALGFEAGQKLCILSENRPAWTTTDFAALACGGLTVPIYTTLVSEQARYIIDDSDATVVVVSNADQWKKIEPLRAGLTKVRHYITFAEEAPAGVLTLAAVMDRGRAAADAEPGLFDALVARVKPGDEATLIYTSGTTGVPKGVILTHDNLISNIKTASDIVEFSSEGHGPVLPAPVPHPRADGHVHVRLQGLHGGLRRERRSRGPEPPGGPAAHHGQRAPGLREDLHQGHGPGPEEPRAAAEDLLLGPRRREGLRRPEARRASRSPAG